MIDIQEELVAALAHRYDIEREIGHGGMAIVYLARDAKHGRQVAVKVLRPELATSLGAERFLREINIAARLTHPNILALHDSGDARGMLYYVMPYVEGETLRNRLDREHQLPVDDAIAIARQVGSALDYAHGHGVVHRDIKPENILLVGEHVLVADFGLARALFSAGTRQLTEPAIAVGTPAYMSPEQAAADPEVDGRTDQYSLACVLFEMIAGVPPFSGATAAALLAQQLTAKAPSLCGHRAHCPPALESAVERALEKTPADRFRTAREFVSAITVATGTNSPPSNTPAALATSRRRLLPVVAASVVGVAVTIGAILSLGKARGRAAEAASGVAEANSYAVFPLIGADSAARRDTAMVAQRIAAALGEWEGIRVVSGRQVADAVRARIVSGPLGLDDALDIAARLGVAKAVWGEIGTEGTGRSARLTVYDVATRRELKRATLAYGDTAPASAALRLTANTMLRTRSELPWAGQIPAEHPSLSAWLAYDAGRNAVARWDIAEAARQFAAATTIDGSHAQANLWLGLTEMWSGTPAEHWRLPAKRARESRDRLAAGDTALATALLALAERRYPDACAAFRRVVATDTTGVIGWYGVGECLSRDSLVIRDRTSRSGWRFRGSTNQAIAAYLRIVDDHAPPQPPFVYSRLAQLLFTSGIQLRPGHAEGRVRIEFGAYPTLDADTLTLVPYPLGSNDAAVGPSTADAKARALEHNRNLLRRLYRSWAASAPATVEAHAALASLLESLDEIGGRDAPELSALWQIRRARSLSADSGQRALLARTEVRLLVKTGDWARVAAMADSLFAASRSSAADTALAGPAALTGRIQALATILRSPSGSPGFALDMPDGTALEVSPALKQDAAGTYAYALSGACVDSVRGYRARLDRQLASYIPDGNRRAVARGVLLRRVLSVAMPCVGAASLIGINAATDRMVELEQAVAAGDRPAFRAIYGSMTAYRSLDRPGDTSMDYTYMESWMLAALGDTAGATAHLDRSLEALPTLGGFILNYPAHSAALVRAMGLRAELAAAAGDTASAARWGAAVATLWSHADPELQPYVRTMCALGRSCRAVPKSGAAR